MSNDVSSGDALPADGRSQVLTNPALAPLTGLVGEWEMVLSNASFLPDPTSKVTGRVLFTWAQDGALLVMRMGDLAQGSPAALWLIGRDEAAETYTVLYYDDRHVSRVYQMRWTGGEWHMWRDAPGFSQRFHGTVRADGRVIAATWTKSSDGVTWEHDFDVTYTKGS